MKFLILSLLLLCISCSRVNRTISQEQIDVANNICQNNMGLDKIYLLTSENTIKCKNNSFTKTDLTGNVFLNPNESDSTINEDFNISNENIQQCQSLCDSNNKIQSMSRTNRCLKWSGGLYSSRCESWQQVVTCTCNNHISKEFLK